MPVFDSSTFLYPVPVPILSAFDKVWADLSRPGAWWSGEERLAIAQIARRAQPRLLQEPVPPLEDLDDQPNPVLSPVASEVAHRIATDAGRITIDWGKQAVAILGPGRYTEMVAVIVLLMPVDLFCVLLKRRLQPFPAAEIGEPTQTIPAGLGEGGAFVPWKVDGWIGPNVARALSYVPADNKTRMELVASMYAGSEEFVSLVWENRALVRPQVELLAARTSALNECFY